MAADQLPVEVQRFIEAHVNSAERLEVLLLLHRMPDRAWRAEDVSKEVYTVPASATLRLEALVASGFLSSTGGANPEYRYQPRTPDLARGADALAAAYRADRVKVIKSIFKQAPDPVQSFAESFRLRGRD